MATHALGNYPCLPRKLMQQKIKYIKGLDLCIVSYGGVGTSFVSDFFSERIKTNSPHNRDHLKHWMRPSVFLKDTTKILYIYGDPVMATISLFRRNFHSPQVKAIDKRFFARGSLSPTMSLEAYASLREDRIGLEKHFDSWMEYNRCFETVFVKYENFADRATIAEALRVIDPTINPKSFPEFKQRSSSILDFPEEVIQMLRETYSGLAQKAENFSAFQHLPAQKSAIKVFRRKYLTGELLFHGLCALRESTRR